jgi:hypothetical protein
LWNFYFNNSKDYLHKLFGETVKFVVMKRCFKFPINYGRLICETYSNVYTLGEIEYPFIHTRILNINGNWTNTKRYENKTCSDRITSKKKQLVIEPYTLSSVASELRNIYGPILYESAATLAPPGLTVDLLSNNFETVIEPTSYQIDIETIMPITDLNLDLNTIFKRLCPCPPEQKITTVAAEAAATTEEEEIIRHIRMLEESEKNKEFSFVNEAALQNWGADDD